MSQWEPYLHLVFIKLPLSKAVKAYKNKVNRWIIKLGKIIESYGVSMQNWFKTLVLLSAIIFSASCTKPDSHNDQSATGSADRGIASVKGKRGSGKKIKIERKGFLIKHSSLRHLTFEERVAYYRIFTRAAMDFEKGIRKHRKNSALDFDQMFKMMTIEEAYAAPCPSAFWVIDNGQSNCTVANSFFRPEQSPQWATYGPVGGLTIDHCTNNSNRMACPPLGLAISGNSAMLMCTSDSRGFSSSCESQFSNGGIANTVRLLDECSRGQLTSVTNITCADLQTSVERSINMHNENCSRANRSANALVNRICGQVQNAVNSVERRVREELDPSQAVDLPDIASCNALASRVEGNDPIAGEASPHWDALLDVARRNCPNLQGRDRAHMRNIFGSCSRPMPFGDESQLQGLAEDFARNARSDTPSPRFIRNFIDNFGMNPSRFTDLFCGANEASTFINRVDDNVDELVRLSEDSMIQNLRFEDRSGDNSGLTQEQFNALKSWFDTNNTDLQNLVRGWSTVEGIHSTVSEAQVQQSLREIATTLQNYDPNSRRTLAQYFDEAILSQLNRNQEAIRRAALSQALRQRLISPDHQQRAQQSAEWLRACKDEVLRPNGETTVGAGNTFQTPGELNTRGCRYQQEIDVSGYFAESGEPPFIIFRRGINGREAACLEQVGPARRTTNIVGGIEMTTRRIDARNPLNDNDGEDNINFTASEFDIGQSGGNQRPFVLFRYSCPGDPAGGDNPVPRDGTDTFF
jgi:hypothetical protein